MTVSVKERLTCTTSLYENVPNELGRWVETGAKTVRPICSNMELQRLLVFGAARRKTYQNHTVRLCHRYEATHGGLIIHHREQSMRKLV